MNEPASFNGPLPENLEFHDEEQISDHRRMHNVYGHNMAKAAYEGLKAETGRRPYVITRACYAGTQKYSTVWTGDNQSLWSHLQLSIPQLTNLGLSGFAFAGTDIGGFQADATGELLIRWLESALFVPLFRNHAALGTRYQEPWAFDKQTLNIYRKYLNLRYRLIPFLYDQFRHETQAGLPVMRPLVLNYDHDHRLAVSTMNIWLAPVFWLHRSLRHRRQNAWSTCQRVNGLIFGIMHLMPAGRLSLSMHQSINCHCLSKPIRSCHGDAKPCMSAINLIRL